VGVAKQAVTFRVMSTIPRDPGGPLVSVIMPCRNRMPFVGPAVERVLAQDAALELLFVNVGSTDGSLQQWSRRPPVRDPLTRPRPLSTFTCSSRTSDSQRQRRAKYDAP